MVDSTGGNRPGPYSFDSGSLRYRDPQTGRFVQTPTVFQDMLQQANQRFGDDPAEKARTWFRNKARNINVQPNYILNAKPYASKLNSTPGIGSMFLFRYDAKHKEDLPYWDMYPLIFPFNMTNDGFMGINMHYLPPYLRARLMDALYSLTNNKRYDTSTKLRISYSILKSASKFRYFEPCVKRYLNNQVRSRFMYIEPSEWDIALFLPLHQFQKASAGKVWQDSRKAIL